MLVVQWDAWEGQQLPVGLQTVDFFPPTIYPEAPLHQLSTCRGLHAASVPGWGLTVVAHAKANDDHIRLVGAPVARQQWPMLV